MLTRLYLSFLVALVALLHFYFLVLEMFLWDTPRGRKAFGLTPEFAAAGEAMLWQRYDTLECPTLLIRGAESDLLSRETAQAMTRRGPRARLPHAHRHADVRGRARPP